MPELPEVETIKRGLSKRIIGKKITDIAYDWPKSFQGKKEEVIGKKIEDVERRAKVIRFNLSGDENLLFHLKMTGQLIYRKNIEYRMSNTGDDSFAGGHPDHNWHAKLPNNSTRVTFTFDDGSKLFFNDLRKFGWCKVLKDGEIDRVFALEYGLDPFDPEFSVDYLLRKAKSLPNRNIKQFLTDQTIIAGIGNIYADESLFDAGIMPIRKLKDISLSEWKKLRESILKILELGIKHGGTTDSDYVNADGEKGGMQDYLKVYRKTGLSCQNNCGYTVRRMKLGGRGTHFCESCQR